LNLHQNVQSSNATKARTLVKVSLAILFSLMLLATSVNLTTHKAHAASDTTSIIRQVFGGYSDQAIRIATCESSMNPNATNSYAIGNSHAEGLFQILYPSTWYGTSEANASPYDPVANTRAAFEIFQRDGYSWREWECQP
jgi:hypothetical protein